MATTHLLGLEAIFKKSFYLTIWWVDNLGKKSAELCHISVVRGQLIHIETLGMERSDIGTIVPQPVAIKYVAVAYLQPFQDVACLDGGGFTDVFDEAITFGSA